MSTVTAGAAHGTEPVDAKGRDQLVAARPKEFTEFDRTIRPYGERVFFGAYDPSAEPSGLAERCGSEPRQHRACLHAHAGDTGEVEPIGDAHLGQARRH